MSINYFYQTWNFHDLHFFILYYEVYIRSQSIFFFWELLELCRKEVKREKVNEGEREASVPATFIHDPYQGRGSSFPDWQSGTSHHSKMKPHSIKVKVTHFIYGKGGQILWGVKCYFSILRNGNRDDAVSSYRLTKNDTVFHLFYKPI